MSEIHDEAKNRTIEMFAHLGELLYAGEDYNHLFRSACTAALVTVAGCDHASLMMRESTRWSTPVATDGVALEIDRLERHVGAGPCYDAIVDETPQLAPDLADPEAPWPELRERILTTTPVRGMLGFRIANGQRKTAALNLFSDRSGGFTDEGVNQATIVAAFCSVALQSVADQEQITTLREGLTSNREIGKAVGLLMAYHKISDERAFEILRTTSNQLNTKLSRVADQIVEGHNTQLKS